jgi:hypothetical protein
VHIQCYDTHAIPPDDIDTPVANVPHRPKLLPQAPMTQAPTTLEPAQTPEGATMIKFDELQTAPDLLERDDLALESTRDELASPTHPHLFY